MSIYKVLVVALLVALIGLTLFRNKQEIDAEVALAEMKIEAWPVKTTKVTIALYQDSLQYKGVLSPASELRIFSKAQGMVTRLYKEEGESVAKGELIAKIEDEALQAQLDISKASLAQAEADLKRMTALSEGDAVTPQQLEQVQLKVKAEQTKRDQLESRISDTNLRAGLKGKISMLGFKEGEVVGPGQPLGVITNIKDLRLAISVTPAVAAQLAIKDDVQVVVDDYPTQVYQGMVDKISVKANDALKYVVEIVIEGDDKLLPGMFAAVTIRGDRREAMMIPREAVLGGLNDPYVYVVNGGLAVQRPISIGNIYGEQVEVLAGLKTEEALVVLGHRNLTEGVKVTIQ